MPYTVELRLSRAAENRFLEMWTVLEAAGISDLLYRLNYRPHVTLAMYHDIDVARTTAKLARFASGAAPTKVTFPHFTVGRTSMFAQPSENAALRKLHARFERAIGPSFRPIDRAGAWMPHCTIGMELPPREIGRAVDKLLEKWTPISGTLDRLALIKFRPGEVLWQKRLGATP